MVKIELTKYYDKVQKNIISTIIFCMEKSYKKQDIYYNGLKNLIKIFPSYFPDFVLRLYFDDSVITPKHSDENLNYYIKTHWIPLIEELKYNKSVQLIHYNLPEFKTSPLYHIGTIGQFLRYIPMFDYDDEPLENIIVMDIDVDFDKEKTNEGHIAYIKEKHDIFKNTDGGLYFITKQCHQRLRHLQKISNRYNDYLFPCANNMMARKKFPHHIYDLCLEQVIGKNTDSEITHLIHDFNQSLEVRKLVHSEVITKSQFTYGLDEVLLGYIIKQLKRTEKLYYTYITQIGNMIYKRSKSSHLYYDFNKNKSMISIFKEIMGKYYDDKQSLSENYSFYDYVTYVVYGNKLNKPSKTLKVYVLFAKNVLKVAKRLYQTEEYKKFGFDEEFIACDAKMNDEDIFIRDCLLYK
jgi:hypothetical protein